MNALALVSIEFAQTTISFLGWHFNFKEKYDIGKLGLIVEVDIFNILSKDDAILMMENIQ